MQTVTAKTNVPTASSIELAARNLVLIDRAYETLAEAGNTHIHGALQALADERDRLINGPDTDESDRAAFNIADRVLYIVQSGGGSPRDHRNPEAGPGKAFVVDHEGRCNGRPSPRKQPVEYRYIDEDTKLGAAHGECMTAVAGCDLKAGDAVVVKEPASVSIPTVEDQLLAAQDRLNAAASVVDAEAAEIDRLAKLAKPDLAAVVDGKELKVTISADEYATLLRNQKKKGGRKSKRK